MKVAFVFPGQGSQIVSMGMDFYTDFAMAKQTFEEADDALDFHLSKLVFQGNAEDLKLTANAQPAILATSIAILRTLQEEMKGSDISPHIYAGHSLGEYSALVAAGVIDFSQAIRTVRFRGEAMQKAVDPGVGGMLAVLGLEGQACEEVVFKSKEGDNACYMANDNCPGQIILSGHLQALERASRFAKEAGAKRAIPLDVSAPFHCPLMNNAMHDMQIHFDNVLLNESIKPIVSNVTAMPVTDPTVMKELLIDQIVKPVRWRESVMNMKQLGIRHIFECGPGNVLTGLIKKTDPEMDVHFTNQVSQLNDTVSKLSQVFQI